MRVRPPPTLANSRKTTLLKCIAELDVYQKGEVLLRGLPAKSYGIPGYRTRVQYVPQRPSLLPGTPLQFLEQARGFSARKTRCEEMKKEGRAEPDPVALAAEWGVQHILWGREWGTLSGGESQRIALAIALGLVGADILLLDGRSKRGGADARTHLRTRPRERGRRREDARVHAARRAD